MRSSKRNADSRSDRIDLARLYPTDQPRLHLESPAPREHLRPSSRSRRKDQHGHHRLEGTRSERVVRRNASGAIHRLSAAIAGCPLLFSRCAGGAASRSALEFCPRLLSQDRQDPLAAGKTLSCNFSGRAAVADAATSRAGRFSRGPRCRSWRSGNRPELPPCRRGWGHRIFPSSSARRPSIARG